MDGLTARRRLSPWVLVLVAVVVNLPMGTHALTQRSIARSGVDVQASLVDTAQLGEGADASYGVAFRFDETIDPRQTIWTSAVDRATYQSALDTEVVEARVLPDRPAAFTVEGAITSRLAWYLTGAVDAVLLAVVLGLRRARRRRLDPDGLTGLTGLTGMTGLAGPARPLGVLEVDALEDVRQLVPGSGPQTGLDDLGDQTYRVTGEVTRIDAGVVVLDAGSRQVRVHLGSHVNLVGYQQPGRVTARLSSRPTT